VLARRQGKKEATAIPEEGEEGAGDLDKRFGFSKDFSKKILLPFVTTSLEDIYYHL